MPLLSGLLLFIGVMLGLVILWVRALRTPSSPRFKWQAAMNSIAGLVLVIAIVTNISGLGTLFDHLLAAMPSFFVVVWAVGILIELVILGVELQRFARDRNAP